MNAKHRKNPPPYLRRSAFAVATRLTLVALIACLPAGLQATTNDFQHQLNQIESGTLIIAPQTAGGNFHAQSPLSTDVSIEVSGLLARAHVKQTFSNSNDYWIEATYAFPLPDESRVDRMEMRIGERTIKGEIQGKQQARQEYAKALSEGKRASLLESQRANLFTNRVANIPPHETIQITFSYQWQVEYDDGVFGLRVPLTLTPRYLPGARLAAAERATHELETALSDEPTSSDLSQTGFDYRNSMNQQTTASSDISPPMTETRNATPTSILVSIDTAMPLESVTSRSHAIHTDQTNTHWRVSLANAMVPTDRDFTLTWSPLLGHSPLAAVFTQSSTMEKSAGINAEHFASVMVMPPQDLFQSAPLPREVVFVIDTSGSMQGNSIRQARAALEFGIERLSASDTFNVIEFNSITRALFNKARSATEADKAKATKWVRSLRADGGTEMAAAVDASLGNQPPLTDTSNRLRQVVFITDGSVGNEAELFLQIKNTLGYSRLFTVGIGSAPNTWFMRRAAETGRGAYTYIAKQDQVQEQMRLLLQKLEKPVLTEITLQWDGINNPEVYPSVIPDLYAGEPLLFDARWQGKPVSGTLSIQGRHNGHMWSNQLQIDTKSTDAESSQSTSLEKQWAHRKIEAMENSLLFNEDQQSIEQQITDLALHYSMVTRYTSLVAIDQQVAREPGTNTLKRTAVPSAMPHGNTMLLPQGSLGIGIRLLLSALFAVLAILFGLSTLRPVQTA